MSNHFFDRHGQRLTLGQWCELTVDADYRRVALTRVGRHEVSTVWLGLDHSFGSSPMPLIFETMVFGPGAEDQQRYATEEGARAGHADYVTLLRATVADDDVLSDGDTAHP